MYKLHLILKYLLKRRIAWVSLVAVMLCTTMVLVVISVMGGWLEMFKSSFRGLSGDIVIHGETLRGFPYYEEIISAIAKDPACQVEAGVPSIETAALFNFGSGPKPVRAIGLPIDQIDKVTRFHDSLHRQTSPEPPSFDFLDEYRTPMEELPPGLKYEPDPKQGVPWAEGTIAIPPSFPAEMKRRLRFDAVRHYLMFRGKMEDDWKTKLLTLSSDAGYQAAIEALATMSKAPARISYPDPNDPDVGRYYGMIVGVGVIGIHRDEKGKWMRYGDEEYAVPTSLTLLDLSGGSVVDRGNTLRFYMVDDSHLGVWQYDSMCVYVPFRVLQSALGLNAQKVKLDTGNGPAVEMTQPARVTDIHIKMKPGIDPNDETKLQQLKGEIQRVVKSVIVEKRSANPEVAQDVTMPQVETWQDVNRIWISAVENEKLLTVMLFGIMCIVAIFLIFCIFYMIVAEKTRDIGIIKSVGATSSGVAGIFLGYGLVIGVIGSGMGLLLSYLIVHNINEMHEWLGAQFGVRIWDPQVYVFDKIPNHMSGHDIMWIVPTAIFASVLGAIPAIRAARMNPVEALRWE